MRRNRLARLQGLLAALLIFAMVTTASPWPARAAAAGTPSGQGIAPFVEGQVLVRFKPGVQGEQRASLRAQMGLEGRVISPGLGIESMHFPASYRVQDVIDRLKASGLVEVAQPNFIYRAGGVPNDPHWTKLWGLQNTGQAVDRGSPGRAGVDIGAVDAWGYLSGTGTVIVAVIDTGVEIEHPEFGLSDPARRRIWVNQGEVQDGLDNDGNGYVDDIYGWDFRYDHNDASVFDDYLEDIHGTHVAGTIAALTGNGVGIAGVASNVLIMPLKFLGGVGGTGTTADAALAVEYATLMGAHVINASWGGAPGEDDHLLRDAIGKFPGLFVAAAGNDGVDSDSNPVAPAGLPLPNILSVAAVNSAGGLASFSNYGALSVDLGAPGESIYSLVPKSPADSDYSGAYYFYSGTSMAAPHVAGAAAVLLGQKRLATAELIELLKGSGASLDSLQGKTVTGKMINLRQAVATAVVTPAVSIGEVREAATSSYTVEFTLSGYGALGAGERLFLDFPAGTTVPPQPADGSVTVTLFSAATPSGTAALAPGVTGSGQTLAVPLPLAAGHGERVRVAIGAGAGLINPAASGSYTLAVRTENDPVPVATAPYSVGFTLALDRAAYQGLGAEGGQRRKAQVTVVGPGANRDSGAAESLAVVITSPADAVGLSLTLTETGPDTGIFTGPFGFAAGSDGAAGLIGVGSGVQAATVTATLLDHSVSSSWQAVPASVAVAGRVALGSVPVESLALEVRRAGDGALVASRSGPGSGSGSSLALEPDGTAAYLFDLGGAPGSYGLIAYGGGAATLSGTLALGYDLATIDLVESSPGVYSDRYSLSADLTLASDTAPPALAVTYPAGGFTSAASAALTGTTEPYLLVELLGEGAVIGGGRAAGDGSFSLSLGNLAEGSYGDTLRATDFVGNSSTLSYTLTVDRTPPEAPSIGRVATGDSAVGGTAEPLATVAVRSGDTLLGSATASATGGWTLSVPAEGLTLGAVLTATATDRAGNAGPAASATVRRPLALEFGQAEYRGVGAENGERKKLLLRALSTGWNQDSALAETLPALVRSAADPAGLALTLLETGPDTGLFEGWFGLTYGPTDVGAGLLAVDETGSAQPGGVTAEVDGLALAVPWAPAEQASYLVTGSVLLAGYGSLAVELGRDGAAQTGSVGAGPYPWQPGFSVAASASGSYTLTATGSTATETGTAVLAGLSLTPANPSLTVVTTFTGTLWLDLFATDTGTLTLAPPASTYDQAAPALVSALPGRSQYVDPATPIRFIFHETITPVTDLTGVRLERVDGTTTTPVTATASITDSTGGVVGPLDSLSLGGFLLDPGASYQAVIPAGTLQDGGGPPNPLMTEVRLAFTTRSDSIAAVDGLPACGGSVAAGCVSGLTVTGTAPSPWFKVRVTASGDGLRVQVLNTENENPLDLGSSVTGAQVRIVPETSFSPVALRGAGAGEAAPTIAVDGAGELVLTAAPVSLPYTAGTCDGSSCAGTGTGSIRAIDLTVERFTTQSAAFRTHFQGGWLLAPLQHVGGPVYDSLTKGISFTLAGPALDRTGAALTGTASLFLPDGLIQQVWGRDPAQLQPRSLVVKVGTAEVSPSLTRLAGGWQVGLGSIPLPTAQVSVRPRGLSLTFNRTQYAGLGSEDVTWDGSTDQLLTKALVTLVDNGSFSFSPSQPDLAPVTVYSEVAGSAFTLTLTETLPDSGIFTGSFGFSEAPASDGDARLLAVSGNTDLAASVTGSGGTVAVATAVWVPATAQGLTLTAAATATTTFRLHRTATGELLSLQTGLSFAYPLLSEVAAGEYILLAGGSGYSAVSAPIQVDPAAAAGVRTELRSGVVTDALALPVGLEFAPDVAAPAPPLLSSPPAGTVQASATVSGTADPYAWVAVSLNGAQVAAGYADASGAFTWPLTGLSTAAAQTFAVTQTDPAGNLSPAAQVTRTLPVVYVPPPAPPVVIDRTPPDPPVINPVDSDDLLVTGTAEPGSTVTLTADGVPVGIVLAAEGSFFVLVDPLKAGVLLMATAQDLAGNSSQPALLTVTKAVDRTAPNRPALDPVDSQTTRVTGTAEPGALVAVRRSGALLGEALADEEGSFAVEIPAQAAGALLTVTATDEAGNRSAAAVVQVAAYQPGPGEGEGPGPGPGEGEGPGPSDGPGPGESHGPAMTPRAELNPDGTASLTLLAPAPGDGDLLVRLPESSVTLEGSSRAVSARVVEVPADSLRTLAQAGRNLVVEAGVARLELPADALAPLAGPGGISLTVRAVQPRLSGQAQPGLRPAGQGVSLVLTPAGGPTPAPASEPAPFSRPVRLQLPFQFALNPAHLGIYRLNPATGQWEYRGGRPDPAAGTVTVELTSFSQYAVMEYTRTFADLPAGHWARADIELMAARHIARGTSATEFSPGSTITRAQFAALLVRTLGLRPLGTARPTFDDVRPEDWFYSDVETAAQAGLILGAGGRFRPGDRITRQELAVMLARALVLQGRAVPQSPTEVEAELAAFADGDQIAAWARQAAAQAVRLGLLSGRIGGRLDPAAHATRAEAVVLLKRLLAAIGQL